jgi:hypothetical protein
MITRPPTARAMRRFNVNGMRSALNNFILDGVDNNSHGTGNQGFSNQVVQVTPDAVEEFKGTCSRHTALLQRHVQVHRVTPVRFIKRLEEDAVDVESERRHVACDRPPDITRIERDLPPVRPGP